jgi:hypothetical protein
MDEYASKQVGDESDHQLLCIRKDDSHFGEMEDEKNSFGHFKTRFEPAARQTKEPIGRNCQNTFVLKCIVVTGCIIIMDESR